MSRTPEFVVLSDAAARAVAGPGSRHAALIEDAFKVLIETPGGGISLSGDSRARSLARRAVLALADLADSGTTVTEADVRMAVSHSRTGESAPAAPGAALVRAPLPPMGALARAGAAALRAPAP